ncbi:MAG: polyprenyl synthetase family protein, partial [Bacteroidota bacterium]
QKIYDFGESVGMAFQLQDDLLDAFGDEVVFGKKNGGDIRTNKKTYLYLKALELADANQEKELKKLFSMQNEDADEKVEKVLAIFHALDIENKTRQLMEYYYSKAIETLADIDLEKDKKEILILLANSLMKRNN